MGNYMNEVAEARYEKDPKRKYRLYKKIYKKHKNDLLVKFEYAKSCINIDNEKAEKLFLELQDTKSGSLATLELAKLRKYKGEYTSAKENLESLLTEQNKMYAMLELGKQASEENDIETARKYFEKLISIVPNHEYALLELGRLERKIGNIEKAKICFEKLINTSSRKYVLIELAALERSQGNFQLARKYLDESLNVHKTYLALNELAILEKEEGNILEAISCFEKLLLTKDRKSGLLNLTYLYLKEGNIDLAYQYFAQIMFEFKENKFNKIEMKTIFRLNTYFNYLFNRLEKKDCNDYFSTQLYQYSYGHFMYHVDKHFKNSNILDFNDDVNKQKIVEIIKNNLDEKHFLKNSVTDVYNMILPFEVSQIDGITTNTIEVITILNTNKILTFYPIYPIYNKKYEINKKNLIKN